MPFWRWNLKLARLPIPPHPRSDSKGFQRWLILETGENRSPLPLVEATTAPSRRSRYSLERGAASYLRTWHKLMLSQYACDP